MIITVFEHQDNDNLFPINQLRGAFELRCGAFTNLERILNSFDEEVQIQLLVPDLLKDVIQERYPHAIVNPDTFRSGFWLNGKAIWNKENINKISSGNSFTCMGNPLGLYCEENISFQNVQTFINTSFSVSMDLDIPFIHNIWDPIFLQSKIITHDAQFFLDYKSAKIHPSVILENADNIYLGEKSEICPGVILDAKSGPIIIADNVYVDIGALIQGPAYIGPNSIINPGAKLRKNITLGPHCKIGGEIEDVIFQGYSNKQHDGFLGHSYIGEWVNLGANTNNSNLKNNYGSIRIKIRGKEVNTGCQFLGSIISDYVRTGISTMLNTGTIIDIGANVFGGGFQPKYIQPFQWGNEDITELDKFFDTIINIKKRRNKELGVAEKKLISTLYKK
tara:strand:- start:3904 stop:5079 length:1176 start_codon:yes stop_codon:yes gene_type:complete